MKEGWEKKKLGEVADILNGYAFKSELYEAEGVRIIRITNVQKGYIIDDDPKFYSFNNIEGLEQYILNDGDLLMSLTGNVGRVGVLTSAMLPAALNQRVACIRVKNKQILNKFLFHLFNSDFFEHEAIMSSRGIAQKNMSTEWLKSYMLPVPPLSVQESIVSELDMLSGIISKHKALQEEYDRLEQSIFYDMFGDPVTNEKGWEVKKLEELGTCCSGGTPSRKNPKYFEGDINWFSAGELNTLYVDNSLEKITQEALETSAAKLCPANSLFIGMYDTAAFKMSIPKVESCSNQACANIVLNKDNVIWLYFVLQSMKEEALKNRHGARQKNLNLGYIKSFQVPLPPLSLQQSFADKISAIEQMKAKNKAAQEEAEMLFNERMAYYF